MAERTMSNPYAPRVSRTTTQPESLSEVDQFIRRLRDLGATDEEVQTVRDTWDDLDPEWTVEQRAALTRLPDDELRAELAATRAEYRHDTRTTEEQDGLDATAYQAKVRADASEWIGQPVARVLERVGDDVILAIAVLDLETGPDGAGRKTLIAPLQQLVAGSDDEDGIRVEYVGDEERAGEAIDDEREAVNPDDPHHTIDLDTAPDIEADSLTVSADRLPDAEEGDLVLVRGPADDAGVSVVGHGYVDELLVGDGDEDVASVVIRWWADRTSGEPDVDGARGGDADAGSPVTE